MNRASNRTRAIVAGAILVIVALQVPLRLLASPTFERVSVASDRSQADYSSSDPSISADGRFVAFSSAATNLVPGDNNGHDDIFVHDRVTGLTTRESVGPGGEQANANSGGPSISANGRFVAFFSNATNLVPGVSLISQVYVRDRLLGVTILVSASNGVPGNGSSGPAVISADGRFVAFSSFASTLVPGSNGRYNIFTCDLANGTITRDSVASDGTELTNGSSPSISDDGRYVAFESSGNNLLSDVFVHDRLTGQTTKESASAGGGRFPTMSGDGRFVAFLGPFMGQYPLYLRDRQTGQMTLVFTLPTYADLRLSPDGRYLVFQRLFPVLNSPGTIVLYDRMTAQLSDVVTTTFTPLAVAANALAFSTAKILVPEDTNGVGDIYVFGESLTTGAPSPPTGLTASSSGLTVTLSWSPPLTSAPVTGYIIEAGSRTGATDLANFNTANAATTFSTAEVGAGSYYVRVRATNSAGTSAPSNEALVTVGSNCAGPGPPSNLSAAIFRTTVTLTWAPGVAATSYRLLVGSGPGLNDVLVSELGAATMGTATNVRAGTYFVRLQSLNACGQSGVSNEALVIVR